MTKILLITTTPEAEDLAMAATGGQLLPLRCGQLPRRLDEVMHMLGGAPLPDVLILDGTIDPDGGLDLAAAFADQGLQVETVLIADHRPDLVLAALRSGISDVVAPADGVPALQDAVDRAVRRRPQFAPDFEPASEQRAAGQVISVVSPKGGVGKTTVASNVAVGLARRFPGKVVLVDLDIQFGDVASALDLEPEYFLQDTVRGQASRDAMALKTILTEHETGVYVICAPDSPVEADSISGDDITRLIRMLATEFQFVVVDTAPGLSEHTLSALDETTDLVLLSSMEVPGVRGLRKELDTLVQLNLLPAGNQVLINFADPRGMLSLADIEATIGRPVDLELPRSKAASDSVNQGVPLLQSGVRDPLTKQLQKLVDQLAGGTQSVVPITQKSTKPSDREDKVRPRRAASRWSRTRHVAAR